MHMARTHSPPMKEKERKKRITITAAVRGCSRAAAYAQAAHPFQPHCQESPDTSDYP